MMLLLRTCLVPLHGILRRGLTTDWRRGALPAMILVTVLVVRARAADDIQARDCFLRLKDQAQVPAETSGTLRQILVDAGDAVDEHQEIARLDDRDAALAVAQAEVDLQVAQRRFEDSVGTEVARAAIIEAEQKAEQALRELEISRQRAASEIAVHQAREATQLAEETYERVMAAQKELPSSVSDQEIARLRYELRRGRLEVGLQEHHRDLQGLQAQSQQSLVAQQQTAVQRLQVELKGAEAEHKVAALTIRSMELARQSSRHQLERHRVKAPLSGMIVERMKHPGEWVEKGEPVFRIVRLDRLLVEGYVSAAELVPSARGWAVTVRSTQTDSELSLPGTVVFVSPEVDAINGQVLVRAEVENPESGLRPGMAVNMFIHRP